MKTSASHFTSVPAPRHTCAATKKAAATWTVSGVALIVAGAVMLPTMVLTAIGAVLMLGGVAVITSAYLRTHR